LADLDLLKPVIKKIGDEARLHIIEGADHSFHVPKSTGKNDEDILNELSEKSREWMNKQIKQK
jgi:hypothetical protein